jgi:hypothetical protein
MPRLYIRDGAAIAYVVLPSSGALVYFAVDSWSRTVVSCLDLLRRIAVEAARIFDNLAASFWLLAWNFAFGP